MWRGVTFLGALAAGVISENVRGAAGAGLAVAAVASLGAFVYLVYRHRRVRRRQRWHSELARLAAEGLARLERRWDALPAVGGSADPAAGGSPEAQVAADGAGRDHPYADDLDVLGPTSLRRLLSTPSTGPGREMLGAWLLAPASPEEVRARQEAVLQLAEQHDFREELTALARLAGEPDRRGLREFERWCGSELRLRDRPLLVGTAWTLPAVTLILVALWVAGVVPGTWCLIPPALALGLMAFVGGELAPEIEAASAGATELDRFADVFDALVTVEGDAPELDRLRRELGGPTAGAPADHLPAGAALRRLARRVSWAEARHSSSLHLALQALFLWDVHVLRGLERWKASHGASVPTWLAALGRAEALCALATLGADHPDWCMPTVGPHGGGGRDGPDGAHDRDGLAVLEARGLGHPLLPPDRCVPNDVEVGPAGTFLLVTGSNMSGKSTLLRAIGLAVVLARAGGPVPARRCSLPALRVYTAMTLRDSLARGVSQYVAELQAMARVVGAARGSAPGPESHPSPESPEPVLYLLDEPLQGTNEAERRVAIRTIVRHLLATPAMGAVATHDLRLHAADDLAEAARPVHFTGTVREGEDGPELDFDYRLRPGPATSTNALDLLRAVGLGDDRNGEDGPGGA